MTRAAGAAVLALFAAATPLEGQASGSQANLVIGVAGSYYSGKSTLWFEPRQPLPFFFANPPGTEADTVAVGRDIGGGVGLMFYGMYFPNGTLGFSGEIHFLGTDYEDRCAPVHISTPDADDGPNPNLIACNALNGGSQSTSTVLANLGMVARAWSREQFSPYARLGVGVGIVNRSSIDMIADLNSALIPVYDTDEGASLTVSAMGAVGFTLGVGRGGYQFRTEVRDNYVGYRAVTQATVSGVDTPPTEVQYHHLFSIVLGFEIVLEKSRGRRY